GQGSARRGQQIPNLITEFPGWAESRMDRTAPNGAELTAGGQFLLTRVKRRATAKSPRHRDVSPPRAHRRGSGFHGAAVPPTGWLQQVLDFHGCTFPRLDRGTPSSRITIYRDIQECRCRTPSYVWCWWKTGWKTPSRSSASCATAASRFAPTARRTRRSWSGSSAASPSTW